jgi:hypothetical protein
MFKNAVQKWTWGIIFIQNLPSQHVVFSNVGIMFLKNDISDMAVFCRLSMVFQHNWHEIIYMKVML